MQPESQNAAVQKRISLRFILLGAFLVPMLLVAGIIGLNWWMLVSVANTALPGPLAFAIQGTLVLGVLAVLAAVASSFLLSRWLLRSIDRLNNAARSLSSGKYEPIHLDHHAELGQLANSYNRVAEQIQESVTSLETRVAERTRMLETSIEVTRRISTILDMRQLVREVVDQLQTSFGFYHAHIYLFDETRENLVLQGGTGQAGKIMLANGHKIPTDKGLVGRAATRNVVVLVSDITQDAGWLSNPLLPDTKSELAVPIALGARVLGVLDVQQDIKGGITPDDAQLVQSVASQVAVAVENARAYSRAQKQAVLQSAVSSIGQRIQQAASVDEVLQVAVSELGRTLEARRSKVEINAHAVENNQKN